MKGKKIQIDWEGTADYYVDKYEKQKKISLLLLFVGIFIGFNLLLMIAIIPKMIYPAGITEVVLKEDCDAGDFSEISHNTIDCVAHERGTIDECFAKYNYCANFKTLNPDWLAHQEIPRVVAEQWLIDRCESHNCYYQAEHVAEEEPGIRFNYEVTDAQLDTCWYSVDNGTTNQTIECGEVASP